jgi:hypothetical protein
MCFKITCDNFIINYFFENKKKEVSIKVLEVKKYDIEKAFDKCIYIDLYKDSIRETIYYNKNILSSQDGSVIKCEYKKIKKDMLNDLNYYLPCEIKKKYLNKLAMTT